MLSTLTPLQRRPALVARGQHDGRKAEVTCRPPPRLPAARHRPILAMANNASSTSWLSQLRSKPPAAAAALTGAYALVAGGALCAAPSATLAVLAPAAALAIPPGWIRLGGLILATFGAQYALTSYYDCTANKSGEAFYRASVPSRLALALALALLVWSAQVERGVLILAALNATGALSMRKALSRR